MEVIELSSEYMNGLARQTLTVSAFLGGFSMSAIIMLLDNDLSDRIVKNIFKLACISALGFLVAIFSMTKILMMTTAGFPFPVESGDLFIPRIVGILSFLIGAISMIGIIALSGWTKSKSLGRFTTVIGVVAFILLLLMSSGGGA